MTLVNLKELLKDAQDRHYAVMAANLINLELIKAGIHTAEKLKSPLILQIAPVQFELAPLEIFGPLMVAAAKKASVPICVHLDHGSKLEEVILAIDLGFTSVMIDASGCEFEDNVQMTRTVVEYAKQYGVSVEAELGCVGAEGMVVNMEEMKDKLTSPEKAIEFVSRTGCDALAIAIGNAHGPYIKTPELDFKRLEEIRKNISIPLVLHGGSGISESDFQKAIRMGITKVNIATALHQNVADTITEINHMSYPKAMKKIEEEASVVIKDHMEIFMSVGKV